MQTFTEDELKLIRKLRTQPEQTILQIKKPCLLHSYCNPLPLFRVYKIDDASFQAEWNDYHWQGPMQVFKFEEVPDLSETRN